jgi:hypothetical protein
VQNYLLWDETKFDIKETQPSIGKSIIDVKQNREACSGQSITECICNSTDCRKILINSNSEVKTISFRIITIAAGGSYKDDTLIKVYITCPSNIET